MLEFGGGGALDLGVGDLVASLVPLSFGAGWYVLGQTMILGQRKVFSARSQSQLDYPWCEGLTFRERRKDHPQDTLPSTAIQLGMTALANIGWLAWQKGGDAAMELGMQIPQVLQALHVYMNLCLRAKRASPTEGVEE